jgi:hypothetical protein
MAESFETLGAGNGFSSCLEKIIPGDKTLLNPPSLEQTMQAYWNFDSVTFGGATFSPNNEPKDLICNESANVGFAADGDGRPGFPAEFTVKNSLPTFFFKNGVKYYKHGIEMTFAQRNVQALSNGYQQSNISISYVSSLFTDNREEQDGYQCITDFFGPPGEEEPVGKVASDSSLTVSSVTISGIPFIKLVGKGFAGSNYASIVDGKIGPLPPCPTPNYADDPGTPTLNFHTY